MDNIVTINNTKENILQFDVSVQGLDTEDTRVKLVIDADNIEVGFNCRREEGSRWAVTIPPLPFVKRTAYPFRICVVIDGYFFEPLRGTMNVVGSAEIYSSTPKNVTISPPEKESKKDDEKKEDKKDKEDKQKNESAPTFDRIKGREKGIDQIAREMLSKRPVSENKKPAKKNSKKKDVITEDTKTVNTKPVTESEKDKAVLDAIKATKEKKVVESAKKKVAAKKKVTTPTKPAKKPEPKKQRIVESEKKPTEKDENVMAILEEFGERPDKSDKHPRVTFIKGKVVEH